MKDRNKKIISSFLVPVLCLGSVLLAGCNKNNEDSNKGDSKPKDQEPTTPVTPTDSKVTVEGFEAPQSLIQRTNKLLHDAAHQTRTSTDFESSLYVYQNETYKIGDDNPFKVLPELSTIDVENSTFEVLSKFKTNTEVFLKEGDQYTKLTATLSTDGKSKVFAKDTTTYVTESVGNNTYDFEEAAIGKVFKLSILPDSESFEFEDTINPVVVEGEIVDGYNVTKAVELALLEKKGTNEDSLKFGPNGREWWDEIKQQNGLDQLDPSALIFHNDLTLTAEDIPHQFYYTVKDEVKFEKEDGSIVNGKDAGLPIIVNENAKKKALSELTIDDYVIPYLYYNGDVEYGIFDRFMEQNEIFTIHGNNYSFNLSKMPLQCAYTLNDKAKYNGSLLNSDYAWQYGEYCSTISFLQVNGIEEDDFIILGNGKKENGNEVKLTDKTPTEAFIFSNFSLYSNSGVKQFNVADATHQTVALESGFGNPVYGGGLIFCKTMDVAGQLKNINSHNCLIPYYSRDNTRMVYIDCKGYDSFNNALFVNGQATTTLENCTFKRAGGPSIVVSGSSFRTPQHTAEYNNDRLRVTADSTDDHLIIGDDHEYLHKEYPTVYADKDCEFESYLNTNSQYFITYSQFATQLPLVLSLDSLLLQVTGGISQATQGQLLPASFQIDMDKEPKDEEKHDDHLDLWFNFVFLSQTEGGTFIWDKDDQDNKNVNLDGGLANSAVNTATNLFAYNGVYPTITIGTEHLSVHQIADNVYVPCILDGMSLDDITDMTTEYTKLIPFCTAGSTQDYMIISVPANPVEEESGLHLVLEIFNQLHD